MTRKESLNRQVEKWGNDFLQAYLNSPIEGDTAKWIHYGVEKGIIPKNRLAKERLALKIGMIFSFTYKTDGSELTLEDLDTDRISQELNIPQAEIIQITNFMAEIGIIKSKAIIKRNNGK